MSRYHMGELIQIYLGGRSMFKNEENRNSRRDKKRYAARYKPVRHGGVKGFSKYEWLKRKQEA